MIVTKWKSTAREGFYRINLFMRWDLLAFIFFMFSYASANDDVKTIVLSQDFVETKLGADWKGIVFACSPYCRFISIKEVNSWSPPFKDEEVLPQILQFIKNTDPLYPLLVERKPIQPYTQGIGSSSESSQVSVEDKIVDGPPENAVAPFGFGWAVQTGVGFSNLSLESDTEIQAGLRPSGGVSSTLLELDIMKGKPIHLAKMWIQLKGGVSMEQSLSFPLHIEGVKAARGRQVFSFQPLVAMKNFKLIPGYIMETEKMTVSTDSLYHYGWTRNNTYLHLGYQPVKRWTFSYDYLLNSQITDQQSFRIPPLRLSFLKISAQYCSQNYSLFDLNFGLCGGASYLKDEQTSAIDESILSGKTSTLKWSELQLRFTMRIGEDLFQ